MPRDGSLILSNVRGPMLAIGCEARGGRGRYRVERLMAGHGDAKLTDLLVTLADCPKCARPASTTGAKEVYRDSSAAKTNVDPVGAIPRRPQALDQRLLRASQATTAAARPSVRGNGIVSCAPWDGAQNDADSYTHVGSSHPAGPAWGSANASAGSSDVCFTNWPPFCQRVVDALRQVDSRDQTSIGWPVKLSEGQQSAGWLVSGAYAQTEAAVQLRLSHEGTSSR
jgi:hypothetical protein